MAAYPPVNIERERYYPPVNPQMKIDLQKQLQRRIQKADKFEALRKSKHDDFIENQSAQIKRNDSLKKKITKKEEYVKVDHDYFLSGLKKKKTVGQKQDIKY